jgi:tetratricopeptide (TPR) repeat protein
MGLRNVSVLLLLGLLTLSGCETHRPVDDIRRSGNMLFDRGEYAQAAGEYGLITERYPGDWHAQYRLGLSLLQVEQYTPARRALEVAHSQRPANPDVAAALAEVMYRQGDNRQLFDFLQNRAKSTQSELAYRQLAHYALEMGDPDSAKVAIETAIVMDEGRSVEPYLDAATMAEQLGDMDLAVRRLRQAYGINPLDQRVRRRLQALGEVPGPTIALPPGR